MRREVRALPPQPRRHLRAAAGIGANEISAATGAPAEISLHDGVVYRFDSRGAIAVDREIERGGARLLVGDHVGELGHAAEPLEDAAALAAELAKARGRFERIG